ncbi:putative oxoglutarate dehydrogenase (succinyl-transferring) [Dioscorea sansibarensis]
MVALLGRVSFMRLLLSTIPNYTSGGTVHIIVNNQVAFTTKSSSGRCGGSGCVCELAAEWRQMFLSDVVIDLVCYRRFGHIEMYQAIRNHPGPLEIYQKKLLDSGQLSQDDIERMHKKVDSILNEEFINSKDYVPKRRDWFSAHWAGFKSPEQISCIRNTGYAIPVVIFYYVILMC